MAGDFDSPGEMVVNWICMPSKMTLSEHKSILQMQYIYKMSNMYNTYNICSNISLICILYTWLMN